MLPLTMDKFETLEGREDYGEDLTILDISRLATVREGDESWPPDHNDAVLVSTHSSQ